jgi:hypothetical protein
MQSTIVVIVIVVVVEVDEGGCGMYSVREVVVVTCRGGDWRRSWRHTR